jgi:serine/threonine protein kinase
MPYDTHRWPTGDTYAGEWTSDMRQMHGRGIYTNAAGRYEGEYSYGKRHGRGVFVESTGARYDGEHVHGHKCGQGTVIMAGQLRGHEYRGEFRNGAPHGRGSFKWPDGSVFTGQHERSCPTQGVLVEANGRQYDVTYASDCGIFWNSLCKALPSEMIGTYPDPQASGNDHRAVGPPPTPRTKNPTQEQHRKDNQQERDLQERQRQQHEQEESVQRARAQQARRERERQQREQEEGGRRAREAERREREESERLEREQRAREDAEQDISKRLHGDGPPVEVPTELVMRWTNNFSDERKIGEGAFGDVFEGILADSLNQRQARVAVKRLKPEIRLQGDEEEQRAAVSCIRREIHVLSSFHHPNIIRLLGHTSTSVGVAQELCLVYELGYASLDKMLTDDEKAHDLTCRVRIRIAADISRALNYLHSHHPRGPAFHRDVKSANIVLTLALRPKLIDCGLSKFVPDQNSRGTIMSTRGASLGTPGYMCTTYLRTHKFDAKSENFSYGIVLLELLLGRVQGLGEDDLYGIYIEEETPISNDLDMRAGLWIPECAEQLENLARECLSKYSKRIATMMAVMRRLIELEKDFCSATAEELRLTKRDLLKCQKRPTTAPDQTCSGDAARVRDFAL